MNIPCPDDKQLKLLILEAFNELPVPDPARMQRIAATLNRQHVSSKKPRKTWLFWLLLGGSMTATAWWAGERFFPTAATLPQQPVQSEAIKQSIDLDKKEIKPPVSNKEPTHQQQHLNKSPIIDQREQY